MIGVDVTEVYELASEAAYLASRYEAEGRTNRRAALSCADPDVKASLVREAEFSCGMAVYWRNAERKARALSAECSQKSGRRRILSPRLGRELEALRSEFRSMRQIDRTTRRSKQLLGFDK